MQLPITDLRAEDQATFSQLKLTTSDRKLSPSLQVATIPFPSTLLPVHFQHLTKQQSLDSSLLLTLLPALVILLP